jgi:hypothetical protein
MGWDDEGGAPAATPAPDVQASAELAALDAAGRRAVDAEDYAAARAAFARELELRRALADRPGVVYALIHVAWVMRFGQDDAAAARPLLEEALTIARTLESPRHVGAVLGELGGLALDGGHFATAARLFAESYALLGPLTRDAGTNGALL